MLKFTQYYKQNLETTPPSFKTKSRRTELLFHKMNRKIKASQKEDQKTMWKP